MVCELICAFFQEDVLRYVDREVGALPDEECQPMYRAAHVRSEVAHLCWQMAAVVHVLGGHECRPPFLKTGHLEPSPVDTPEFDSYLNRSMPKEGAVNLKSNWNHKP